MKYKVNSTVTTQDAVSNINPKIPQYIAAAAATIGGFGMGTVLAFTSPAIPNLQKSDDLGTLTDDNKSWIGSLVTVGALLGAPFAGYFIEKIGRKFSMLAFSVPFIVGWLTIAIANTVTMLYAGRFLTGFGVGALSLAAPVFISEISEDSIRGCLGAAFQLMVSLGILFTFVIGTFVSWSWLAMICGAVPIVFAVAMAFMPESPRYYLSKGKYLEANESMCWLRAADKKAPTKEVIQELDNIQHSIDQSKKDTATLRDLLKISILKPVSVILLLMFFNQFCGVNAVQFYATEIFEHSGTGIDSNLSTIIVGIVQVIATLVASSLVDRAGRRILLLLSFFLMSTSLLCLGAFFFLKKIENFDLAALCWLPLGSVVTFNVGYFVGLGPLVWTLMSELLPSNIIGLASAISTTFNWTLAFIVTRFFRDLLTALGIEWCFWLFSVSCALGFIFVLTVVPETKGKSLEEIQEHFKSSSTATSAPKCISESTTELVEAA